MQTTGVRAERGCPEGRGCCAQGTQMTEDWGKTSSPLSGIMELRLGGAKWE